MVEPHVATLPPALARTGATLVDVDPAIETCEGMIVLVDHDLFRAVSLAERGNKVVLDTRGIWPDQPTLVRNRLRLAS